MKSILYILFFVCSLGFGQQFARPSGDSSIGAWTGDPINTTGSHYQNIDETTASDTDFVRSEDNPASSTVIFNLSTVVDPESSNNHIVRYRYRRGESGGGSPPTVNLTVTLRSNGTNRQSNVHSGIDTAFVDGTFTLSGISADAISDYSTLEIQFLANKASGARTSWVEVGFVEFEVPAAGGAAPRRIFNIN